MRIRTDERDSLRGLRGAGLLALCLLVLGLGSLPMLACSGGDENRVEEAMEEIEDEAEDAKENLEDEIDDRT